MLLVFHICFITETNPALSTTRFVNSFCFQKCVIFLFAKDVFFYILFSCVELQRGCLSELSGCQSAQALSSGSLERQSRLTSFGALPVSRPTC